MASEILVGILGIAAVAVIAWFSQGLKKFVLALVASFFVSVGIFTVIGLLAGNPLPDYLIPIFMMLYVVIELWRESSKAAKERTYAKQQQ